GTSRRAPGPRSRAPPGSSGPRSGGRPGCGILLRCPSSAIPCPRARGTWRSWSPRRVPRTRHWPRSGRALSRPVTPTPTASRPKPPTRTRAPRLARAGDMTAADGLVIVDKPAGLTSHDVVARLRRLTGPGGVGHGGTLDPWATGVLVAGVGKATRLLGHLALAEKESRATIRLGQATSTADAEGEVISGAPAGALTLDAVRA